MKISYTTTLRDLLEFQLYHLSRSPVSNVIGVGCLAFMSYLFYFHATAGVRTGEFGLAPRIVATVMFAGIVLFIFIAFQLALLLLHLISRRNKTLLTEHTVTLGEDGFMAETAYSRSDLKWTAVQKLRWTRRHLFV